MPTWLQLLSLFLLTLPFHLPYKIYGNKIIIKYIFMLYDFSVMDVDICSYIFGQALQTLTVTKFRMQSKQEIGI
jgi:hypothetical protein